MKEIGSDYNFNPFNFMHLWFKNKLIPFQKTDKKFFASGRIALKYIINNLPNHHFLIPDYLCESIRDQFINKDYYEITNDLQINLLSLIEKIKEHQDKKLAILTIDYFGKLDPNICKVINLCKDGNILLVQDFTHDIFTNHLYGSISFCSYRKMLPTPYGGYLIDPKNILPKQKFNIHIIYLLLFLLKLFSMFLKNFGFLKFIWRPLLNICEKKINNIVYFGFDYLNYFFYQVLASDIENIMGKRKQNNTFLKIMVRNQSIERIRENNFSYPLVFNTEEERDLVRNKLIQNKIYSPIYWPNDHPLSKKILFIPLDQRYNPKDYQSIVGLNLNK